MTPPRIRTRSGRKPRARFHASWSPASRTRARRTAVRLLGVLIGLVLVTAVGANVYAASVLSSLPDIRDLDAAKFSGDTIIQDRSGKLLADIGNQGDRRISVNLDQISPKVMQGTVAIEDRNFWTNPGFDPEGILRAATSNLRSGGIVGGGSTITQQLAKRLFLSPRQTLDRKVKELVLAYQLSQTYSKRQILQLYLNESYYGDQQYGVQAAAQTYFHRDARSVDLAQAAMLAGLPQAPDAYSPISHLDMAKQRQKEVLDAMVRDGYVTPQDAASAFQEHLDIYRPVNNFLAPHFVNYVVAELQRLGFKPGQQQMRVTTTLDYGKQQIAEADVRDNLKANLYHDRDGELNSSLVSMDPKTGQILAYVGSPDINGPAGQYDLAGQSLINAGSSVKLFTYAKAIADGKITMDTPIEDAPNPLVVPLGGGKTYKVQNFDKRLHGTLPARVALASSYNIPAVKVELAETVPVMVDWYRSLGMRPRSGGSPDAPNTDYGPSLTLGGYGFTLVEEATALSAIADMGVYHPTEAILQVTDAKGTPLYQADPARGARQAVPAGVAFIVASILVDDNNRAPAFGLNSPLHISDRRSAAKTGTNEDFRSGVTVGFTPDLATAVWIGDTGGKDTPTVTHVLSGANSDAVFVAAPLWHKFMVEALRGVPDHWYDPPPDVTKGPGNSWLLKTATKVDRLPGDNPSPKAAPSDYGVPTDPGTGPQKVDNGRLPPQCRFPFQPGCITPQPPGGPPQLSPPPGG